MQQFLLQQIVPNLQSSGAGLKSLCGKPATNDNGFENVLKGMLGVKNQNTASPALPASINDKEIKVSSTEHQQGLLNSIIKKLGEFLKGQAGGAENQALDPGKLEEFLTTSLTDEEISFLQQFLQQTAPGQNPEDGKNTGLLNLFGAGNNNEQGLLQNDKPQVKELGELIAALSKVIEATKAAASQSSAKQELPRTAEEQKDTQNSSDMLIVLRDKLQQIYNTFTQTSQNLTVQNNAVLKTPETTGANTEKPAHTNQQQIPFQNTVSSGEQATTTPQTTQTAMQSDKGMLNGIEQFLLGKQALQKLSASTGTVNNTQQENPVNTLLGKTPEATPVITSANGENTLSLFYQTMGNKEYIASFQPENRQTLDQVFTKLKMMNTLSSSPEIAVKIDNSETQSAVKPVVNKGSVQDNGFNASSLLKDAVITQSSQQTTVSTDKADSTGKFMAKTPVNSAYVMEQLTDKINTAMHYGVQKLSIQLNPPSLGKLDVDLSMKNNQLRAVIVAETSEVKQLLQSNMDQLRTCLESQNIKVENVSVMVGNEGAQQQFDQYASHLRERADRGRRHGFYNTLSGNSGDDGDSINGMPWNTRHIIQTDMVDVFA